MGFETLDEGIEWESRWVAAAFGVEKWERAESDTAWNFWGNNAHLIPVRCSINKDVARWSKVAVGPEQAAASFEVDYTTYHAKVEIGSPDCNELLVRGMYCLGWEGQDLCDEFGVDWSAHQIMEIRLSMPREFWPQKWLDEGAK